MSTGQRLGEGSGATFFFDAGAISLDFVYTGEFGVGMSAPHELLARAADLGAWIAERVPGFEAGEPGDRDLADALAFRAALGRLYRAAADGTALAPDDVDTVNLYGAVPDVAPTLDGGHRQAGAARVRTGQVLSLLARDGIRVLAAGHHHIRRCAAADCRMVFHDESRTGTRRWCAMERCGNRAKVRAHRERHRGPRAS